MRRASTLVGLLLAVMAVRAGAVEDLPAADDCQVYLLSRPTAQTAKGCWVACVPGVAKCFQRLDADLRWLEQDGKDDAIPAAWSLPLSSRLQPTADGKRSLPPDRTAYLLAAHDAYRQLKRWRKELQRQASDPSTVRTDAAEAAPSGPPSAESRSPRLTPIGELRWAEEQVDARIHPLMRRQAESEPFFGVLLTGPVVQDVGKKPDGSDSTTRATATVSFESKHVGHDEGKDLHWSLGGSAGYAPVFLMTVPEGSGPDVAATPGYQGGFVLDLGPNVGFNLGSLAEVTALGRWGVTRVGTGAVVDQKDPAADYIAVPSDAGTGRTKDFWAAAVRAVVFRGKGLQSAHERGYLLPAASLEFGWRWDKRFAADPRLAGYAAPDQRMYFSFRLNALKVFEKSDKPRDLEVTFGVEREWARQKGGLPAGTKLVFAGTLNLLQMFGSGK